MRVSVILSTYNSPTWLEKVLWGYSVQSHCDFEIVVADDGSTAETACLIKQMQRATKLVIRHVWHADRGFRKCRILNRAVVEASADYLVFTDGDCIPHVHFLSRHVQLSKPGYLLSGGCVRLPSDISDRITADDVVFGRVTNRRWLAGQGLPGWSNWRKLTSDTWRGTLLDTFTPTRATFNGCNSSTWREDVLAVNGFDERMEYGGLDRELGERLRNAGVRTRQIRHRAACVHLHHDRSYVRAEAIQRNRAIRRVTRQTGSTWTSYGILARSGPPTRRAEWCEPLWASDPQRKTG